MILLGLEFSQESSNVIDILETSSKAAENGAVDTVTDVMSAKDRFEKEKVQRYSTSLVILFEI